jgi:Tol biopolymer transport system component
VRTHRERGITLVAPDSGTQIEWTGLEPAFAASENPIFSPDGRRLAFTKMRDDFSADVYVAEVDADGRPAGPPTQLAYGGRETSLPIWTADGRSLLVIEGVPSSNGGVRRVPLDGSPASPPIGGLEHAGSIALDRSGTRLALHRPGIDVDIWRLDLQEPAASGRVAPSTLWEEGGDISADGTRLAFASNRSGPREIWVSDVSGEHALQLTRFGGPVPGSPRWSPDRKWIAFDARPDGNSDVFVVPAAGGPIRQLTKERNEDARPVWSRDGKTIFFASSRTGRSEIWKIPAEGGQAVQVTRQGASNVAMSWDGRWIYYQGVTAPLALHRARLDGSEETLLVDEDVRIGMFTATEHGLWYVLNPAGGRLAVTLKVLNLADGTRREAATVDFVPIPVGLSVSADERYATITRNDRNGADLLQVTGFR